MHWPRRHRRPWRRSFWPSRRGFLRTTVTTAAVVGTSGALAGPAFAQQEASGQGRGRHRCRPTRSASSSTPCATSWPSTWRAPGAPSAIGYTRVEHAGFVGRTVEEFKAGPGRRRAAVDPGHVLIPQPFDPAAWSASLADANTLGSRYIVHPLRDRLRHRRGDPDHGTLAGVRRRSEPAGRMARRRAGSATTTTTGSSSADRQPARPPTTSSRGHRPGPGPPGTGSVLGHPGARPRRPHRAAEQGGSCSTTSRT